jgi:hypothetical protein
MITFHNNIVCVSYIKMESIVYFVCVAYSKLESIVYFVLKYFALVNNGVLAISLACYWQARSHQGELAGT